MKFLFFILFIAFFCSSASAFLADVNSYYDLNWGGSSSFFVLIDCDNIMPSRFNEGDWTQYSFVACLDLNCFEAASDSFVIDKTCSFREEVSVFTPEDANVGIFLLMKKVYEPSTEWEKQSEAFFYKQSFPLFSSQSQAPALLPVLPPFSWGWLFYIGIFVCFISFIVMFKFAKLGFFLLLAGLAVFAVGIFL